MDNKVIVTGSKGLIGSAITSYLTVKGYQVDELDIKLGHDLTDEHFVKSWFSKNKSTALVNLFALNDHVDNQRADDKLMDINLKDFENYLHINLTSLFSVCREFARNNEFGSIVNFTSIYGIVSPQPKLYGGSEKNIAYGVSKAGVIQLTRHLAVHLAPRFRVNCVAPHGIKYKQNEEFEKIFCSLSPFGRMMKVEEIFGLIEFLISDQSSYCTGSIYYADGGWTAW
jgi:NAD(P)-dependent dehydrogenase (short-subunit alcohol dehydrogenase family)